MEEEEKLVQELRKIFVKNELGLLLATDLQNEIVKFIEQEIEKAREEVLLEIRDELLEQIEKGKKYNIYGGVADYQDALHLVGGMLSKLKEKYPQKATYLSAEEVERRELRKKFEAKGLSVEIKTEGVVEEEVVHLFNILVREVDRFMREEVVDRRGKELLSKLKE